MKKEAEEDPVHSRQCCGAGAVLMAGAVKKGAAPAPVLLLKFQL